MPIARSASQAAASATAPITLGEPASKRSGASAQITSSSVTSLIAPPPCSSGSPPSARAADERAGAERRVELVAGEREVVDAGRRPCRSRGAARAGRRRRTARRRGAWASAASSASGHTSPVTLEAPVTASRSIGRVRAARCSASSSSSRGRVAGTAAGAGRGGATGACSRGARPAWRAPACPAGSARGEDVDRLGGVADEDDVVVAARRRSARRPRGRRSYAAVETCDFAPVPRWTLLYHGTNASTASHTAAITGRAGGVVEVDVAAQRARRRTAPRRRRRAGVRGQDRGHPRSSVGAWRNLGRPAAPRPAIRGSRR